jgi:FlaA1/EpsC-like NDP-sugar epimerase
MEVAYNMLYMFGLLRKIKCEVIYLDELVRHRIIELLQNDYDEIIEKIHNQVGFKFIATPDQYPNIIIWGAGQQAKYLLNKSKFIKQTNLIGFVDSTPSKIGEEYLGYMVYNIDFLKENKYPVAIAAVQGYPLIYEQMNMFEIDKSRLIKELII